VPIRSESRCICGHRLKEHKEGAPGEHRCAAAAPAPRAQPRGGRRRPAAARALPLQHRVPLLPAVQVLGQGLRLPRLLLHRGGGLLDPALRLQAQAHGARPRQPQVRQAQVRVRALPQPLGLQLRPPLGGPQAGAGGAPGGPPQRACMACVHAQPAGAAGCCARGPPTDASAAPMCAGGGPAGDAAAAGRHGAGRRRGSSGSGSSSCCCCGAGWGLGAGDQPLGPHPAGAVKWGLGGCSWGVGWVGGWGVAAGVQLLEARPAGVGGAAGAAGHCNKRQRRRDRALGCPWAAAGARCKRLGGKAGGKAWPIDTPAGSTRQHLRPAGRPAAGTGCTAHPAPACAAGGRDALSRSWLALRPGWPAAITRGPRDGAS
jgi:hypothetical protein